MKVNILGTDYKIIVSNASKHPTLTERAGVQDYSNKTILIDDAFDDDTPDINKMADLQVLKRKVIRHELIHAFFDESGLETTSRDEMLVDWIAAQFPKMQKAFESVGVDK